MNMQQYFMPVRVMCGERIVSDQSRAVASFGKRILLVTGRNSAKICGALQDVEQVLKNNGQISVLFDQVMSNPTIDCVYEGARIARQEQADAVIAIGGGSPMDAAKAIAMLAKNDLARADLFSGHYPNGALPMIHIPTTAGTGSEVTPYAILTNEEQQTKTSMSSPDLFPKLALLDAKYLEKLPARSVIYTAVDALSHSIEGMLTKKANVFTDSMAYQAISMFSETLPAFETRSFSYADLERLLRASALAGMVIANTGTSVVHTMGYSFTYFKGIDHGCANGLLLGSFLELAQRQLPERVGEIVHHLRMQHAKELTACLRGLILERPSLTEEEIDFYTRQAASSKKIQNGLVAVSADDIRRMFADAAER